MPVAAGEWVLITKNNRAAALTNGQLVRIKAIDAEGILLENGRRLDRTEPLHLRQGYTITSQTSQGHEREKMFGLLTVSASSQINAVQMLVSLSRASREVRLYTDSFDVLREVAIRPGMGRSALELVEGMTPAREATPDLQENAMRTERHSEVSPVRTRTLSLSEYEQSLRKRAAQRYPDADPELSQKIERTIQRRLQEYRAQEAARRAKAHERHRGGPLPSPETPTGAKPEARQRHGNGLVDP
jgi:hypothetical protein